MQHVTSSTFSSLDRWSTVQSTWLALHTGAHSSKSLGPDLFLVWHVYFKELIDKRLPAEAVRREIPFKPRMHYEGWLKVLSLTNNHEGGRIVCWELVGIISNQIEPRMSNFSVQCPFVFYLQAKPRQELMHWSSQRRDSKIVFTLQRFKQKTKFEDSLSTNCYLIQIKMGGNSNLQSRIWAPVSNFETEKQLRLQGLGTLVTSVLASDFRKWIKSEQTLGNEIWHEGFNLIANYAK